MEGSAAEADPQRTRAHLALEQRERAGAPGRPEGRRQEAQHDRRGRSGLLVAEARYAVDRHEGMDPMNASGGHWIRTAKRRAIYARDGYQCQYCLLKSTEICSPLRQ